MNVPCFFELCKIGLSFEEDENATGSEPSNESDDSNNDVIDSSLLSLEVLLLELVELLRFLLELRGGKIAIMEPS